MTCYNNWLPVFDLELACTIRRSRTVFLGIDYLDKHLNKSIFHSRMIVIYYRRISALQATENHQLNREKMSSSGISVYKVKMKKTIPISEFIGAQWIFFWAYLLWVLFRFFVSIAKRSGSAWRRRLQVDAIGFEPRAYNFWTIRVGRSPRIEQRQLSEVRFVAAGVHYDAVTRTGARSDRRKPLDNKPKNPSENRRKHHLLTDVSSEHGKLPL